VYIIIIVFWAIEFRKLRKGTAPPPPAEPAANNGERF
jgi:hypothetical protein